MNVAITCSSAVLWRSSMPSSFGSVNFELGTSWDSVLIDLHFRDSLEFKTFCACGFSYCVISSFTCTPPLYPHLSSCTALKHGAADRIAITCENQLLWQSDSVTRSSVNLNEWITVLTPLDQLTSSDYKVRLPIPTRLLLDN
ncbi:hypothetical protein AHF37_08752 [Paragonimus kellicotti]|nr:hypothetical protein AHF37_08752 [Paragonimus kellicotti]